MFAATVTLLAIYLLTVLFYIHGIYARVQHTVRRALPKLHSTRIVKNGYAVAQIFIRVAKNRFPLASSHRRV